jgi:hypothetical protein
LHLPDGIAGCKAPVRWLPGLCPESHARDDASAISERINFPHRTQSVRTLPITTLSVRAEERHIGQFMSGPASDEGYRQNSGFGRC